MKRLLTAGLVNMIYYKRKRIRKLIKFMGMISLSVKSRGQNKKTERTNVHGKTID